MTDKNCSRPQGVPPDLEKVIRDVRHLVEVVARLRAPDGCPWDRVQTLKSIRPHTLEETYELLEAIDADDDSMLQEELGDLLLQVILYAQIAKDEGRFELSAIVRDLTEKLIRRHPHVFGDAQASTPEEVIRHWERVKQQEKQNRKSPLEGVPIDLPALARSSRLQSKASKLELSSPEPGRLLDSFRRSIEKLLQLVPPGVDESARSPDLLPIEDRTLLDEREAAFGETLFLLAELARRSGINPEDALRSRNRQFQDSVESALLKRSPQE